MRRISFLSALFGFVFASGQSIGFQTADSLSLAYYLQGDWHALDSIGKVALREEIDYPLLRMRIGYADYMLGNYAGSMKQYEAALAEDHSNLTARWFLYADNRMLGRDDAAMYHAGLLPDSSFALTGWKKYDAVSKCEFMLSAKFNQQQERSDALYVQASIGSRIGRRISLNQSIAFYTQNYYLIVPDTAFHPPPGHPPPQQPPRLIDTTKIRQWQYSANLGVQLSARWSAWGSGSVIFDKSTTQTLFGLGVKYERPKLMLNADAYYGRFTPTNTFQAGAAALVPLGRRLYLSGRTDFISTDSSKNFVPGFGFGLRVSGNTWLSVQSTLHSGRYFTENKGIYIYNMPDACKTRYTVSLSVPVGEHCWFSAHYTYENLIRTNSTNYSQNSITGGLLWKR